MEVYHQTFKNGDSLKTEVAFDGEKILLPPPHSPVVPPNWQLEAAKMFDLPPVVSERGLHHRRLEKLGSAPKPKRRYLQS
jgi:hypothetical protein